MPLISAGLLGRHLGVYGQRELVSVIIPGTILLIEAWLLVVSPEEVHRHHGYLKLASSEVGTVNSWILGAALLVGVLSAYMLGLLARMAAWAVFIRVRKMSCPTGPAVRRHFDRLYGADAVEKALAEHEPLRSALETPEQDAFFQYTKLWLRQNRPLLAIEQHEAEINFLVAVQAPLLVAAGAFGRQGGWTYGVVSLLGLLLATFLIFAKALARSNDETYDAMRNFLFAQWFGEPPAAPPEAATQ